MLAADRLGARHRLFRQRQEILRRGRTVGSHTRPDLGSEGHRHVAPQRPHGQDQHLQHRESRQDRRREVGAGVVHRQAARVRHLAFGVGLELEKLLAIGNGELAERGATLVVGDARQRSGRERERRVAPRQEVGKALEPVHGTAGGGGGGGAGGCEGPALFRLSATTAGRGSRCTPSDLPATVTRSMRLFSIARVI